MIGNPLLLGDEGYQIQRSLRFRSSASAYLNRTPASASNRKTWTWSGWVKRGTFNELPFISCDFAANNSGYLRAGFGGNTFSLWLQSDAVLITTQVFRDPSAWYHMVVAVDTTQATAANRYKIYVNGVQITSFSYDNRTIVAQNTDLAINSANSTTIGYANSAGYADGYMAEVNFIDGQALTPSSFGAINATTGVWSATRYNGTYGTNGFYLNFTDNSAATAATIGKDNSGNGNNWTPNNISVTAGATYDSMLDAPLGAGGGERGNYCTISPFQMAVSGPLFSLSSGNLDYSCSASAGNAGRMNTTGSMALLTGKTYWEVKVTNTNPYIGIGERSQIADSGSGSRKVIAVYNAGQVADNTTATYTGTTFSFTTNDVIGFAFDGTAMTMGCYKNGSLIGTWSGIDSTVTWLPSFGVNSSASSTSMEANFGQRPFSYTPPTGFKALHTGNLGAPVIALPAQNMAATLYTGTGAAASISNAVNGVSFQPDWVWIKSRNNVTNHSLTDSVRGVTKIVFSNSANAESTFSGGLSSFDSGGFSLATGGDVGFSASGYTYVGWQWKAGGTAVSNTAGSITSSVSANTTAGFSVVTYTGTGATATVGHGLGVTPTFMIFKSRTQSAVDWPTYHISTGNNGGCTLNETAAKTTNANWFNSTTPTSTVFSVGSAAQTNGSTQSMLAYCFAPVAGYSAFGSYTGNGSTDGPFVFLGFRPRFVMVKRTDVADIWLLFDSARNTYNIVDNFLAANLSDAEQAFNLLDFLSNGFKIRASGNPNQSGGTFIYMAFAENPFKNSLAR